MDHSVHFLTVKEQPHAATPPPGTELHLLGSLSRPRLRTAVAELELDCLLLNPERSRRYRGLRANVLRSAYGTEHYRQKVRSFRSAAERSLARTLRVAPWVLAERRWERAFYEATSPRPQVVAQSEYMKGQILESYRIPHDNVHVIHNAVDTDEFAVARARALRSEMRERLGVPAEAYCLLFLGHNFRLKGLWQILRLLPGLDTSAGSPHLLVVGRGTGDGQRRKARRLVERSALTERVTLTGPVRPSLHALAAADALLHLSWHDSFGFVALEAMACGLPVVTTRFAGASELIEHGVSGLIVDPSDDGAIRSAIRDLAEDQTRRRIGSAAAASASRHDEPGNFEQVLSVLKTAAERSPGPVTA